MARCSARLQTYFLLTVLCVAGLATADVVLEATGYSGKDWVWKNRFTTETMALDGNHKIISGDIWWDNFPVSGTFKIQMEGVTYKSQGETPYRFYIDGTKKASGKIPCNRTPCPCAKSSSGASWKHDQIVSFGTHSVQKGDRIKFWAESAYCGGLSSAGSYSSFKRIRFIGEGITTPQVAKPSFSPSGGTHVNSVDVSISTKTSGATIRYTLDGSKPTSSSKSYSGAFTLTKTTTVKARAFKDGMDPSDVASATFQVDIQKIDTVRVVSPNGGESFFVGDEMTVSWQADLQLVYDVNVELSADNGKTWKVLNTDGSLQPNTDNGGAWTWTVKESVDGMTAVSDKCLVRVVEYLEGKYSDVSDGPFVIAEASPVSNTSPSVYEWAVLVEGAKHYLDREYTISNIPDGYVGAWFLRVRNDDKFETGDSFITFTASVPLDLFIAIEDRGSVHGWMDGYVDTGDDFTGSDSRTYSIYRKSVGSGTVTLGGNEGDPNMYTPFVMRSATTEAERTSPPARAAAVRERASAVELFTLSGQRVPLSDSHAKRRALRRMAGVGVMRSVDRHGRHRQKLVVEE